MKKIGLFYAPKGGSTEDIAKRIAKEFSDDSIDVFYINEASIKDFEKYENLIIGTATVGNDAWDGKHPKSAWDSVWSEYAEFNFSGKKVALFGLGNQLLYANNFVDALGQFGKKAMENGAEIVGMVQTLGYEFADSDALIDGEFIGLPIDEDTEPDKTDERIKKWVVGIKAEFEDE